MIIKITEIEANADELRASNTLSQNVSRMLTMALSPSYRVGNDDDEDEDGEEE